MNESMKRGCFTLCGSKNSIIRIFGGIEALSKAAADLFAETAQHSVESRGRFVVALSGGQTPRNTYRLLADPPYRERIPWLQTYVFWGDERCVPRGDPNNNARMAFDIFLSNVPIPESHVYPIPSEDLPEKCAVAYEKQLRDFFENQPPRFDLILLGLGKDGHTASLFPNTPVLEEQNHWVRELYLSEQSMNRITFTPLIINQAVRIAFLVQGADKADIVRQVLAGPLLPRQFPAQLVCPTEGELLWLLDDSAAAGLE